MTCPSRFALAQWEGTGSRADIGSEIARHVGQCGRCATALGELADARHELLGADPSVASLRAARRILAAADERRAARRFRWWVPAMLMPVAALLAVFVLPRDTERATGMVTPAQAVRVKGGALAVEAYYKRGQTIVPVTDGAELVAGDRLRFAYTKAEPGQLMVFSVDDGGAVFPYYQDGTLGGIVAQAGSRVMLPGSVELDGHRGWERVFALWSSAPLDEQAVRKAVAAAMAGAGGDVRRAVRLDLPVEQASYLLRRP